MSPQPRTGQRIDVEGAVRETAEQIMGEVDPRDPAPKQTLEDASIRHPEISTGLETGAITEDEVIDAVDAVFRELQRGAGR